jgi:hypothetical protein
MALLARCLARNNPQRLQLGGRELVVVVVRALVGLTGIVVAASNADVVLVASFELLKTLDFVAAVLHG